MLERSMASNAAPELVELSPALDEALHFVTITSRVQLGNAGTPGLMYL
jgi:hypothetical protein